MKQTQNIMQTLDALEIGLLLLVFVCLGNLGLEGDWIQDTSLKKVLSSSLFGKRRRHDFLGSSWEIKKGMLRVLRDNAISSPSSKLLLWKNYYDPLILAWKIV